MKRAVLYSSISIFIVVAGCAVVDLTKTHQGSAPKCEIHNVEMHPEHIKVYGESVYVPGYIEIAKKQFPNHGGHLLSFEKSTTPWERNVIDFVCPLCDNAYREYWSKKKKL